MSVASVKLASVIDESAYKPSLKKWRNWLDSPAGQQLLAAEQQALDRIMPGLFGYHLLSQSVAGSRQLAQQSTIRHIMHSLPSARGELPFGGLVMRPDELPFAENSLDVIVLHHVLDFARQPHQVLREAIRALIPSGHLVVVGYNPAGLTRLRRWPALSKSRLNDWLTLLSCRVEHRQGHFVHRFNGPVLNYCQHGLADWFGVFSVTVACKEVSSMIPIRPSWRVRPLLPMPVARPSMRNPKAMRNPKGDN
ncbi:methyltransferase domain-containing protein [Pokkaliibacter sp. MBI-7]|uniref:class I SAM-dependent methyltransferase n=1 Tax=Pokkaliibacter TaxID=2301194 RepID=UPI001057BDDB|nr:MULTISPECIES: methyltransferase domain-containing protein [Pokkaliibacter]MDH2436454.1 methyltransferase domain-containing protein [Pokkaliibacter sp. MBI-7]